jgi:hypothetical protein
LNRKEDLGKIVNNIRAELHGLFWRYWT